MTPGERESAAAVRVAAVVSGLLIAFQVAGRSTRDALFLSQYPVESLPRMMMPAAAVALLAAVLVSRPLTTYGPGRVLTVLFAASAALLLAEWPLVLLHPQLAAVAFYIHFAAFGALLVSAFWSAINERFDPRAAKRAVGTIAAAGTAGGLAGGFVAALVPGSAMLPVLAAIQLAAVLLLPGFAPTRRATAAGEPPLLFAGAQVIAGNPYVRTLVGIVLLVTLAEGLLEYVFKSQARQFTTGDRDALLRFFAVFNTSVALLSMISQALLSRPALARLGLARTVGVLPWATMAGALTALALYGLPAIVLAMGAVFVTRNSLYRSGFEVLFTPLPEAQKRATKPLIDVGVLRLGDALAAGVIALLLMLVSARSANTTMLVLALGLAGACLALILPLHSGYVSALERSLLSRSVKLELEDVDDQTTRSTLLQSISGSVTAGLPPSGAAGRDEPAPGTPPPDDVPAARLAGLRSRDPAVVRQALAVAPLEAAHVPHAIDLLAWDEVSADALRALRQVATRHCGQLVDALLDPEQEFTVRRRLPDALAAARSSRAVDGLVEGLGDRRFEVRFRCGRALTRLLAAAPELAVEPQRLFAAVVREAAVDRQVWESQQLLDGVGDDAEAGFVDEVLRDRVSRSLEHVFTVLALALPRQPLQLAFRGLHTNDAHLRGTALEYLETALPGPVREQLWPFLDDRPRRAGTAPEPRARDDIVADLLRSRESIALNLAAVRQRRSDAR